MQNHPTWELFSQFKELHWVKTKLRNKNIDYKIYLYNIYAPSHFHNKEHCWRSLPDNLNSFPNKNVIKGGHLNLIVNDHILTSFVSTKFHKPISKVREVPEIIVRRIRYVLGCAQTNILVRFMMISIGRIVDRQPSWIHPTDRSQRIARRSYLISVFPC